MVRQAVQGVTLLALISSAGLLSAADGPSLRASEPVVDAFQLFKPMEQIEADIRIARDQLPLDRSEGLFAEPIPVSDASLERYGWPELAFWWAPPELAYQPLYFDDVPLERYGQTPCRLAQPVLSGVHFFGNLMLLPYDMLVDHPCRHISQLGFYRPGSCAPPQREGLRLGFDPAWLHPGFCLDQCRR